MGLCPHTVGLYVRIKTGLRFTEAESAVGYNIQKSSG